MNEEQEFYMYLTDTWERVESTFDSMGNEQAKSEAKVHKNYWENLLAEPFSKATDRAE